MKKKARSGKKTSWGKNKPRQNETITTEEDHGSVSPPRTHPQLQQPSNLSRNPKQTLHSQQLNHLKTQNIQNGKNTQQNSHFGPYSNSSTSADNNSHSINNSTRSSSYTSNNKTTEEQDFFIGDKELNPFITELFGKLVKVTNVAKNFPEADQYNYCKTAFPSFEEKMQREGIRILDTLSNFQSFQKSGSNSEPIVSELYDVSEQYDSTVDLLDHLLESVDSALDELDDSTSKKKQGTLETNQDGGESTANKNRHFASRPQLRWEDIDNSVTPFYPKLKEKPNALVPLKKSLRRDPEENAKRMNDIEFELPKFPAGSGVGSGGRIYHDSYPHPYEAEILSYEYLKTQLCQREERLYKGFSRTPCTWVDNEQALNELASVLDGVTEFAIDLEQHSYRSYQGFVCLMQISTRERDYLVDTLELRPQMSALNSSFTNPKIVKVMHGSDCDILWLQRDFGIYVVNLFDTGQAARVLGFPSFSLAYLLKYYCSVESNKKYQTADWRLRPLPSEMVKYARQDTHYLLYIFDKLQNELYERGQGPNLIQDVLDRSKQLSLKRYEKERLGETDYLIALSKLPSHGFTKQQSDVFRALYKWRDAVARKEDESVRYILPNMMMKSIAENLPRSVQQLLNCCVPVPKIVRRDAKLLLVIIEQAISGIIDDGLINGNKSIQQVEEEKHESSMVLSGSSTPQPIERQQKFKSPELLTTEQLYQVAGWVEETGLTPEHLVFTESDKTARNYGRNISISHQTSSSLFNSFPTHHHSHYQNYPNANNMQSTISRIQQSISFQHLQSPTKPPSLYQDFSTFSKDHVYQTPSNQKVKERYNEEDTSDSVDDETDQQMLLEEKVPQSLNEIYKLSKKNRQRNKQKKKLKEDNITDPSPAYSPETSSHIEKPSDFMKKIGWLSSSSSHTSSYFSGDSSQNQNLE